MNCLLDWRQAETNLVAPVDNGMKVLQACIYKSVISLEGTSIVKFNNLVLVLTFEYKVL